jgi:signal transduction histidine kinase
MGEVVFRVPFRARGDDGSTTPDSGVHDASAVRASLPRTGKRAAIGLPRLPEPWLALFAARDRETTLRAASEIVVPAIGDCCAIDLVDPASHAIVPAIVHDQDEARQTAFALAQRRSLHHVDLELGVVHVVTTRRAVVVSDLEAERPSRVDADVLDELRQLGFRSMLRMPLVHRGRPLGALTILRSSSMPAFERRDLARLLPVVRGLSVALDASLGREEIELALRHSHDFLAAVVHDLRSPLAAILAGVSRGIARASSIATGHHVAEPLDAVRRSAERMQHLVHDLLDLARIRTGRFSVELARHGARALVEDAAAFLRPLCEEKGLELAIEVGRNAEALCDHARVLQVLSNLVANAIKFTPRGGKVTLRVDGGARELTFLVRDTGQGIAAEHLPHVFERHWQAHPGAHGGLGLGLAIAREIVLAHGGRIWARSHRGDGTEFSFTLPRAT